MMNPMSSTVLRTSTAVVGGPRLLASRVVDRLSLDAVAVRSIDPTEPSDQLRRALEGVETLVVLDRGSGPDLDGTGGSDVGLLAVRTVLAAAREAGTRSLVVLSSAMVYGARDDNPVPLTEDAPVRPDPDLGYALACAELERLAVDFGRDDPDRRVVILRPAVVLGPTSADWLRRSAWGRRGLPNDDTLAPRQFLHVDDLVGAIDTACAHGLDGAFNVAPDGWIAGDTFLELAGAVRIPVPSRFRRSAAAVRRWIAGGSVPPGLVSYTGAPWVVANDRLRREGWSPAYSSEETWVEADRARGWRALSPRARQEISLGGAGLALAVLVGTSIAVLRRRRRR
jgi:nucleoside-diphosphate-sugar epimerase